MTPLYGVPSVRGVTVRQIAPSEYDLEAMYGSAEEPPRVVENRNLLSHPDDLRKEAYLIRMI